MILFSALEVRVSVSEKQLEDLKTEDSGEGMNLRD